MTRTLKHKLAIIMGALMVSAAATGTAASSEDKSPHIVVSGHAEMFVPADRVDITANLQLNDSNRPGSAAQQAARVEFRSRIESTISELENLFPELLIQTNEEAHIQVRDNTTPRIIFSQVMTQPLMERVGVNLTQTGLTYSASIEVRNSPVEIAGKIYDTLSGIEGMSSVRVVNYQSTQADDASNPAMIAALRNARSKAEALATEEGLRVGRAIRIESTNRGHIQRHTMNARSASMMAESMADAPSTTLRPDQIAISADVVVTYQLLIP